jgi:PRD1 phage membrane DNA delivery
MMDKFWDTVSTIGLGIITVGMIAVIVSRNAQTPAIIQSSASGFGNDLGVAESPVTGAGYSIDLSYPGSGLTGFSPSLGAVSTW